MHPLAFSALANSSYSAVKTLGVLFMLHLCLGRPDHSNPEQGLHSLVGYPEVTDGLDRRGTAGFLGLSKRTESEQVTLQALA
jgi:hypothetical protein